MTSAWTITAAVGAPRAAFVDFPLGHTTGKPRDPEGQRRIARLALEAFEAITAPGTIVDLGQSWGDDHWRADPLRTGPPDGRTSPAAYEASPGGDSRTERHSTPQYQTDADRLAAEARLGPDVACRACVGFDA